MKNSTLKLTRLIIVALFTAAFFILSASAAAVAEETETLRVGYVFTTGYQEGGDGEYKTGLGYDYYQKIAYYTGWNYEYVYGGFGELLEKLQAGEIDIMGNLSYTEERAKTIDFSQHEQGRESYYLYTLKENTEIDESNPAALNGKSVGVSKGSVQLRMFLEWCAENGVVCETIEYTDKAQREEALKNGEIYATVVPTVMANDPVYADWRAAVKIGDSPYYFGLSKSCDSQVKQQLDQALSAIFNANPNYFTDQFNKYYGGKMMESDFWTTEEQQRLSACNNTVKVGYLDNYLPFCDTDEQGKLCGLLADIAAVTYNNLGISFECTAFSRYDQMKAALDAAELDIIFPVRGDYWAAEQQQLFLSDMVCGNNSVLLYDGEYTEDKIKCIAVSDASPFQRYSALINFPQAELLVCSTAEDCIQAVLDGKAGSSIFLSDYYMINGGNTSAIKQLSQTEIADNAIVCFGVRHGDTVALSICEKWLNIISDDLINQSIVAHSNVERSFTLREYIEANTINFLIAAGLLVIAIILGSVLYVKHSRRQNMKLLAATREAERSQRELVEQELQAEAYRLRTEQELNNSRIKIMISQMRPHFLYNALSAIQTIVKADPDYASSLIFDFTTHLRSSITALSSDKPIAFADELKNIAAYLNIEKMRTGDTLKVEYDIRCDTFAVLPLSIQPFAENAARHGIYPKAEEGGSIIIRSYEAQDAYIVEIIDDGVGFDVEQVMAEETGSVGLKNTVFRLKTLSNASVSIKSEIGQGTTVTVAIPKTNTKSGENK